MAQDGTPLLGLEADGAVRDPARIFRDPAFLGSLLVQLERQLGREDAAAALLQLGFLQGLRDATRVLHADLANGRPDAAAGPPATPRLALRLGPCGPAAAGVAAEGSWPDAHEAEARIGALGPASAPCCHASAGYTSGWLSGLLEADVVAVELACSACGAAACRFRAREAGAWGGSEDPAVEFALRHLDFERLRQRVEQEQPARAPAEGLDPAAAAVHVWGPVMVVPFSGADESIAALELIARDELARDVSVVVVDLAGAVLDEAFGALALERVLDAVQGWGAEPVLAGVSPLSAPVVADLQERHVVLHKDLPEAIAAAFQIAEIQRKSC